MFRTTTRATAAVAAITLTLTALTNSAQGQRSTSRNPASAGKTGTAAANDRLTGVMFGVSTIAAPGISISGDFDGEYRTNFGSGVGVMVGYGFTPMWSVFGSLDVAKQGSAVSEIEGNWGLVHFEVGARANFATRSAKTIPYASASIGRRALGARITDPEWDEEYDLSFSGGMVALGGGIQHFFRPTTALDAGLTMGFGSFSKVDDDGEQFDIQASKTTSIRLRVGVTWHP